MNLGKTIDMDFDEFKENFLAAQTGNPFDANIFYRDLNGVEIGDITNASDLDVAVNGWGGNPEVPIDRDDQLLNRLDCMLPPDSEIVHAQELKSICYLVPENHEKGRYHLGKGATKERPKIAVMSTTQFGEYDKRRPLIIAKHGVRGCGLIYEAVKYFEDIEHRDFNDMAAPGFMYVKGFKGEDYKKSDVFRLINPDNLKRRYWEGCKK